jgi:Meckel syndrome type 1 protein
MSGLLGSQLPMFAIAALVLVVAVIAAIFVVRRGGKRARGEAGTRGRQAPRLAMIDSTPIIDGRKLVIVRRDDVEHLVLIGGATDVLLEANIRRAESADAAQAQPRESAPRIAPTEAPPRVAVAEARASAPDADEITKEIPVPEASLRSGSGSARVAGRDGSARRRAGCGSGSGRRARTRRPRRTGAIAGCRAGEGARQRTDGPLCRTRRRIAAADRAGEQGATRAPSRRRDRH